MTFSSIRRSSRRVDAGIQGIMPSTSPRNQLGIALQFLPSYLCAPHPSACYLRQSHCTSYSYNSVEAFYATSCIREHCFTRAPCNCLIISKYFNTALLQHLLGRRKDGGQDFIPANSSLPPFDVFGIVSRLGLVGKKLVEGRGNIGVIIRHDNPPAQS